MEHTSEQAVQPERGVEEPHHLYAMQIDGEPAGELRIQEKKTPFPLYLITNIKVFQKFKERDVVSKLLNALEIDLRKNNAVGVVAKSVSNINPKDIHNRQEWTPLPKPPEKPGLYVFNLPEGTDVPNLVQSLSQNER